jgi:hypothetical protein
VNEIQTGSDQEIRPPGHRGRHRRPARASWQSLVGVLAASTLVVGSCGTPAPAARFVNPAPIASPVITDWSNPVPRVKPVSQRRIEIVDRLAPAEWRIGAAAGWLDRYPGSDMVVVARCSGRAWKCVTVRGGKLSGNTLAQADSRTVTVDTAKVKRRGLNSAGTRKKILVHELAHTFGLGHSSGRNLMATTIQRVSLKLTGTQRAYLRAR